MLNVIKADAYRLLHGLGLAVAAAIYLLGVAFIVLTGSTPAPRVVMENFMVMACFALAVIYLVCIPDFGHNAVRLPVSLGLPRRSIFFARLLLGFALSELLYAGATILSVALSMAFKPGLADATVGPPMQLLAGFLCQSLMLLALCSTATAIAFIARKGAVLNAVFLALFFGMTIAVSLLRRLAPGLPNIDFLNNAAQLVYFGMFDSWEPVLRSLSIGAVYLAVSVAVGLKAFEQSEIK